jgi:hypothetical protein
MDMEKDIKEVLLKNGFSCAFFFDKAGNIDYLIHHFIGIKESPTFIYRRVPEEYCGLDNSIAVFIGCQAIKEYKFIRLHEVRAEYMNYALTASYLINTKLIYLIVSPYNKDKEILGCDFSLVHIDDFQDEAALEYVFG